MYACYKTRYAAYKISCKLQAISYVYRIFTYSFSVLWFYLNLQSINYLLSAEIRSYPTDVMNGSTQRTFYPGALFQWLYTASTERVTTRQLLRIDEDFHANRALCQVSHLLCGVYAASRHFVGLLTPCNDHVRAFNVRKITDKLA